MGFYDLSKQARAELAARIREELLDDLTRGNRQNTIRYFSDEDTYIRKSAYLSVGKIFFDQEGLQPAITALLAELLHHEDMKIRQTVIHAAGEIGKKRFDLVQDFFDRGLFDAHHAPRNAVIGSVKKMAEVNPIPVLHWAKTYLHHEDKEIRREICHGIELRGRTHPEDILPLLQELQHDRTARVRSTLVHVLGQIAYKKGCLPTVIAHVKTWENQALVADALEEIIDVHDRYRDFAAMSAEEARAYIDTHI